MTGDDKTEIIDPKKTSDDMQIEVSKKTTVKTIETVEALQDAMFAFACSNCGNVHFRHAGYIETMLPYATGKGGKHMERSSVQVMVCTKSECHHAFVYKDETLYDVTKVIDLGAWEKAEVKLNESTGPGGEC